MLALLVAVGAVPACLDTHVPSVEARTRAALCEYIAECAPVQTRGVDWSDVEACAVAVVDVEACLEVWHDVRCIPPDATLEDVMASTPSIQAAMDACLTEEGR